MNDTSNSRAEYVLNAITKWNSNLASNNSREKYCRMRAAPLVFYRGTNHLFWSDFSGDDRLQQFGNMQTRTWLQGDLHAYNFGSYHNRKDEVVYDLNDFDDALIADYQYDVWRMAISLVLVAWQNDNLSTKKQEEVVKTFATAYLNGLVIAQKDDKPPYFTKKNTYGKLDEFLIQIEDEYSRKGMLKRWAPKVKVKDDSGVPKQRRFDLSRMKLGEVPKEKAEMIKAALKRTYLPTLAPDLADDPTQFEVKDVAGRLFAGTGSLGRPRYYVLIETGKPGKENDDRILDIKLQQKPTGYAFLSEAEQREHDDLFSHEAQRHALAYKALTAETDAYLGWLQLDDEYYSVRERSPYKEAFPGESLTSKRSYKKLAEQWGAILAACHIRGNTHLPHSLPEQAGRLTNGHEKAFMSLVTDVALSYAAQVQTDWENFVKALYMVSPS